MRLHRGLTVEQVPACHPTQLYEALCYIATFALLWFLYNKTGAAKRRGLMFGVALIGIFVTRFFIEFVKVNQVAFEEGMTLNMGQWLSTPFIIIGIASVWYALSHPAVEDNKKSNVKTR
jgi:prolipoprotein diacylglyceryltransferase